MKFELFPFQMNAVRRLRDSLYDAQILYRRRTNTQAISFTAPTGAGKTIMLAALVEQVYRGDENYPAQPNAIFVWLSDSPELNQQFCDKFYFNADKINRSQLIMIEDDNFDQQTLDDGKIYFLNTQKLGKGSNLTKHSDFRQYTIWETLRNTVKAKTDRIYFIIDEAHRGMKDNAAARATTIMQKFIEGSADDKFEPAPVVIGMSATPARFNNLVAKSSATIHRVVVETEEVKASGLLKERIIVIYPDEQISSAVAKDMAILEAASDEWKNKCEHWQQYLGEQDAKIFNPIFVVQVANGSGGKTSDTDLDECLKKISQRTGIAFEVGEVVHTFGETADLTINGLQVQYRNPSSISGDEKIRVVFFKENLSTGWDCPQAETMMSFRRAVDTTYIAQLLGRMIRTPMRRHIEGDDTLNEVRLYLPYFNKGTVQEIVRELQQSEGENIPTEVIGESLGERKIDTLTVKGVAKIPARSLDNFLAAGAIDDNKNCSTVRLETHTDNPTLSKPETLHDEENFSSDRSETTPDNFMLTPESTENKPIVESDTENISLVQALFDHEKIVKAINAMGLLTYKVKSERINDYLKSLFQMAHFLTRNLLKQSAFDDALDDVATYALYRQAKEFKLSAQVFNAFGENVTQIISQDLFVTTDTDIDRQFRQAEAVLKNEGVSNRYLQKILDTCNDISDGKIDVILFAANHDCLVNLERFAKTKFHDLCDKFRRKTITLPIALKNEYNTIVWNGDEVSKYNFSLPVTISMPHDANGKEYSEEPIKEILKDFQSHAVLVDIHAFDDVSLGNHLKNLGKSFLNDKLVQKLAKCYGDGNLKCSSKELQLILRAVHHKAFYICIHHLKANNLIPDFPENDSYKNLSDFPFEIVSKGNGIERKTVVNVAENMCSDMMEYMSFIIKSRQEASFIEKNIPYNYKQNIAWANIQVNFPKLYVEQLYDVIYPNGYVICFSTDETNSAMWGNYAQNHQGICFIYETQEISGKNYLTVDSKKMEVKLVRYGSDVIERNFFTSLGRLNPKQIKSWLSSVDETTSKLFDTFSKKNIKSWLMQYRLDYVEKFHRKNSAWQHEKEYRILLPDDYYYQYDEKEYRCLKYEPLALKGIIFGINTPIDNKFKIIQKIQQAGDKFRHVEFFQAEYECDTQKIYVRQKKYP